MKKLFGITAGLLLVAISGHAKTAMKCADATGSLRIELRDKNDNKKIAWFVEKKSYHGDDSGKIETNFFNSDIDLFVGDKYNGSGVKNVHFTRRSHLNSVDIDVQMLCSYTHTRKALQQTPHMPQDYVKANLPETVACSNASGNLRKISNEGWSYNGGSLADNAQMMMLRTFQKNYDSDTVYQVFIKYPHEEGLPEYVICQDLQ